MTLRSKGSRALRVGAYDLRFSVFRNGVRGCPDCDRLHVIVTGDGRRGSVVRVCVGDPAGADVAITPRLIARAAQRALAEGWRPGEDSGVFATYPLSELAG